VPLAVGHAGPRRHFSPPKGDSFPLSELAQPFVHRYLSPIRDNFITASEASNVESFSIIVELFE
jgi:hypothetical protein